MAPCDLIGNCLRVLRRVLDGAPPESLDGDQAARLTEALAELERVAGAAKTLYASRAAAQQAHRRRGHPTAAGWLAEVSVEPLTQAQGLLEAAGQLGSEAKAAFAAGQLSTAQARLLAPVLSEVPEASGELLEAGKHSS